MSDCEEVIPTDEWKAGLRFGLKSLNTKTVRRATRPDDVLRVCLQHNLRSGNDRHRHRRPYDSERTHLNEVLQGSADPEAVASAARTTLAALNLEPRRQDTIMGIEMVFQPPEECDERVFYAECLRWAGATYQHIVSAVVHRDQVRPHMHVIALAVEDGGLAGAAMTSGDRRLQAQRAGFMRHMRATLGLRPDRTKTMEQIFTGTGKGPKTRAAAARRDAELERAAATRVVQPHSPPNLIAQVPSTDLIARADAVDLMAQQPLAHDLILRTPPAHMPAIDSAASAEPPADPFDAASMSAENRRLVDLVAERDARIERLTAAVLGWRDLAVEAIKRMKRAQAGTPTKPTAGETA